MQWTLARVLLFLGGFAAFLLMLTAINYIWPFTGSHAPWGARQSIGLGFDLSNFLLAMFSYALIRTRKTLGGIIVVAIWSIATLVYAFWLLLFNPFSAFTVGIFTGLLVFCGFMAYLCVAEARSSGLLKNGTSDPAA